MLITKITSIFAQWKTRFQKINSQNSQNNKNHVQHNAKGADCYFYPQLQYTKRLLAFCFKIATKFGTFMENCESGTFRQYPNHRKQK